MKIKAIILALCALCLVGTGYAQPPGRMDPEQRIQEMITSLAITKEQEPKFREVMAKVNEKRSAMMQEMMANGPGGDRSAMMAKIQELNTESEQLLSKVLTETQMAKYKEQQASRRRPPG